MTIPVITGDPEAAWVGETDKKPVKRGTLATKVMQPYTLAVIVPFSNQFRRDVPALYDELVKRLPLALAQKSDAPVYTETPVTVHNVLVGEPSAEEITTELQLTGRRLAYTLAIPKGDAHDWNDVQVEFFGQHFRTCGGVVQGIERMIPLCWNKKVQVVRDE